MPSRYVRAGNKIIGARHIGCNYPIAFIPTETRRAPDGNIRRASAMTTANSFPGRASVRYNVGVEGSL